MIVEFLFGLALAAGALWFVLRPILAPHAHEQGTEGGGSAGDWDYPEEDVSPQAVALRALKEIEFDRATGKLSDADYEALKQQYTEVALAALRAEGRAPGAVSRPPEWSSGAPRTAHGARCPVCGPRPESDALFCSSCGRRLGAGPGYCARCGAALETDASYCHSCGARVAA